jgi:hypothetical protein
MIHKAAKFVIMVSSFLLWSFNAFAVCVDGNPSIKQEFNKSIIVCIGRVVAERFTPESKDYLEGVTYTMIVKEVFRGSPSKTIQIFSENSSGRFPMVTSSSYLVFIHKGVNRLIVDNCGNSGDVSRKLEEISVLRKMKHNNLSQAVLSIAAKEPQIYKSPDGMLIAKILQIGKSIENKVEIYQGSGALLIKEDYSSEDGEHGMYIEHASWTPDSKFFVYSTDNTGGHGVWQSGYFFYRRRDNKVLSASDYLPPIADPNFTLGAPDFITLTIWSPFKCEKGINGSIKLPITFNLSKLHDPKND